MTRFRNPNNIHINNAVESLKQFVSESRDNGAFVLTFSKRETQEGDKRTISDVISIDIALHPNEIIGILSRALVTLDEHDVNDNRQDLMLHMIIMTMSMNQTPTQRQNTLDYLSHMAFAHNGNIDTAIAAYVAFVKLNNPKLIPFDTGEILAELCIAYNCDLAKKKKEIAASNVRIAISKFYEKYNGDDYTESFVNNEALEDLLKGL